MARYGKNYAHLFEVWLIHTTPPFLMWRNILLLSFLLTFISFFLPYERNKYVQGFILIKIVFFIIFKRYLLPLFVLKKFLENLFSCCYYGLGDADDMSDIIITWFWFIICFMVLFDKKLTYASDYALIFFFCLYLLII